MECPEYNKVKDYANYLLPCLSVSCILLDISLYIKDKHLRRAPGKLVFMAQFHMLPLYMAYTSTWPDFEE